MNNRPNKNIIGDHCDIRGKSIVGDNSGNIGNIGNSQSTNNNSNNELLPYTRIDEDCIRVNSNMNSEVNHSLHGGNKNFIGAKTRIEEYSIVGDWSGNNSGGNINGADIPGSPIITDDTLNRLFPGSPIITDSILNRPSRVREIGICPRKNQKANPSQISGHCIVADNSCNIGNIDDIPNGRGNNNMNNLLKAQFDCKNIIERRTNIQGNSIVGDVSRNTMNEQFRRREQPDPSAASTTKKGRRGTNSTNKIGDKRPSAAATTKKGRRGTNSTNLY